MGDDTGAPQWAGLHRVMLTQDAVEKGIFTGGQPKVVCRGGVHVQPDYCQRW